MPQDSKPNRDQSREHSEEGTGSSSDEQHPRTALGEVLQEFEEAETRVGDERRGKDGESGDAMTPNEKEQEHGERDGA